jgi:uncharacterized protein
MSTARRPVALITGASSGIGRAVALRLAADGYDVVLVARSAERLHTLAQEIELEYGSHTWTIAQDLTQTGCGERLLSETRRIGLSIDVLINNAGVGSYGRFDRLPAEVAHEQITVNIGAVVELTRAFLPLFLTQEAGTIVNIASTAAFQPAPYMAVYAATKAFVLSFSEALWGETVASGVRVIALCPPAVATSFIERLAMQGAPRSTAFAKAISPEHVAAALADSLSTTSPTYIVGAKSTLLASLVRVLPRRLIIQSVARLLRPS